ncbi:glycosyltransferase family 2 protein [Planococcus beigongshangi]|uniref:glycosyltransferase family 2 protein n=1 Tax=Planococcus beigongshangi TaxID=2782536 RepID=UPI00193C1CEC|nr:glycosyltransferase family A protein [Planococcus beigongshangi]
MEKEIIVSIDCASYNHKDYIAHTIESFLMQKTSFRYEILIHDDASDDGTAEIIAEYEKEHPDLIKVIYQTENQYSQGVRVEQFNHERATGKYIAICEGDDYWTDPYKLQKQVEYMEKHPECSLCVHGANRVSAVTGAVLSRIRPRRGDGLLSMEEVIEGGGAFFATNSMMYVKDKVLSLPSFYEDTGVGDYPLTIYLAHKGTIYYIDEIMSAYQVDVKGSWTEREFSQIPKKIRHYEKIAVMLDEFNRFTDFKYSDAIKRAKMRNHFYLLLEQRKFLECFKGGYGELYLKFRFLSKAVKKRVFNFL